MDKHKWSKLSADEQVKWWDTNAPDETAQFKTETHFRKYIGDKEYLFHSQLKKWKQAIPINTLHDWKCGEWFVCEKPISKSNVSNQESDLMLEVVKKFRGVWPKSSAVDPEDQRIGLCLADYRESRENCVDYKKGDLYLIGSDALQSLWRVICDRKQFESFIESLFKDAPDDATHYSPKHNNCHQSWWRINDDDCFIICEKRGIFEWLETPTWSGLELIPRPARKAVPYPYMPKVGEECEFSSVGHHSGFMWCIFRGVMSDGSFIVEYHRNTSQDRVTCDAFNSLTTVFRQIITERDTRAVELYRMFHNDGLNAREIMQSDKFDTYLSMFDILVRIQRGDV